ncbi:MAG: substrate-binding domain-containing protein [Bacteroidota bacterium]
MRFFHAIFFLLLFIGCQPEPEQTATKGRLHILVGESVAPPILVEITEFLHLYEKNGAEISYDVVSSEYAVSCMVLDTAQMIFTTRRLSEEERKLVEHTSGALVEIAVAYDGAVAVVHYKNPVEKMTLTEIRSILEGKITRWEQLSQSNGKKGGITVFLQDSADVAQMLRVRFAGGLNFSPRIRRQTSELQTFKSVTSDPTSVGFVALSWIDSAKVPAKALEISQAEEEADTSFHSPVESFGKFYAPHPAHIYRSYYPLKRAIYMYTRSARGDLASGFGTFVANKEGQKLFLDHGLVPGTQPIRLRPSN